MSKFPNGVTWHIVGQIDAIWETNSKVVEKIELHRKGMELVEPFKPKERNSVNKGKFFIFITSVVSEYCSYNA